MSAVGGVIMQASQVWGGRHFLIVPTDGEKIDEKFWELLEAHSPDYLATYRVTFADVQQSDPDRYNAIKRSYRANWEKKEYPAEEFDNWFTQIAAQSSVDNLELSDGLKQELLFRLSPFHHKDPIDQHVSRASGFGYPFTKITKILSASTQPPEQVILPQGIDDPTLALLIHSQTGLDSDEYAKELADQQFSTLRVPDAYDSMDLLRSAFGARVYTWADHGAPDDYMTAVPFALSMLHLGRYYRADVHMEHREPVTVVLGDTVDDFCSYYSLSRLHDGVYWLPLSWLKKCNVALNEHQRRRQRGEEPLPHGQEERTARTLVNLFFEKIDYGHHEKRIQLCSMSLSERQLVAYRRQMARCSFSDEAEYSSAVDCTPIASVSLACVAHVFEQDNYVNHRSMTFVDGKSVSPYETPRPKNFSEIRLPDHYWITSIQIDGYRPPSIPSLGPKIVNLQNSTTLSRVATDGIAYHCPNWAIFGRDLDALLVRPKIEMPNTMALFREYFASAGVTVEYSDKGNYFLDTLRRFGGLDATGEFIKNTATRSVLEKFMSRSVGEKGNIIYLDNDQRAYLNLGAITASVGDEEAAADLVDTLVGKEVLQRGHILQCERCRLKSWYSIEVLTRDFTCNRCGFVQQYTRWHWRSPAQPHWYYKLAETIYQFYENNSDLTVQVLYKLKSESKAAFHFVPEINLFGFSNPRKKSSKSREMDVACIIDGQIVFGECKTEPLKAEALEKFETMAGMSIKYPARVILATTQKVSDDFKRQAREVRHAKIMTRDDLYDD